MTKVFRKKAYYNCSCSLIDRRLLFLPDIRTWQSAGSPVWDYDLKVSTSMKILRHNYDDMTCTVPNTEYVPLIWSCW